ncbi:hypothetical protein N0V86_001706 [Didymella sp. IMI 355093]|nr:hypothetical protein N0V86_001706 [Didymella sp. IMI 355093]
MQFPRRSVRSIQELPSIHTAFAVHYKAVRTHSASTASNSAVSPDIEDGLEVVPLERDSILSAPIVSAYLDEKEVFISSQEVSEKPLPEIPTSIWSRTWGRMSVKYRVLAVLGLSILPSIGDDNKPIMVTLGMPSTANKSVHCGQQAPEIGPTALSPLPDTDDGPQYYFAATYDRTVILREEQLGQEKIASSPMQGQPKHTTFLPGTSLWRCTFNNTLMEGFLFTEKDAGSPSTINATAAAGPALPYKLKLTERTVAAGSAPYCEKVTVGLDGELEDGGVSVDLMLVEGKSGTDIAQSSSDSSCQCQWIVE